MFGNKASLCVKVRKVRFTYKAPQAAHTTSATLCVTNWAFSLGRSSSQISLTLAYSRTAVCRPSLPFYWSPPLYRPEWVGGWVGLSADP